MKAINPDIFRDDLLENILDASAATINHNGEPWELTAWLERPEAEQPSYRAINLSTGETKEFSSPNYFDPTAACLAEFIGDEYEIND